MSTILYIFSHPFLLVFLLGIVFAIFLIPTLQKNDKKKLEEMDKLISEFHSKNFESVNEREKARYELKKQLLEIKSKMIHSKEATDKLAIL